jgi:ligand-binding sensor domain-containing protein
MENPNQKSVRNGFFIGLFVSLTSLVWGQHYYSRNFTINDGLPSNTVWCILKDTPGKMWIGTSSGLCRFDGKNFQVLNSSQGLVGDNVWSMTEDDQGNLWIGCMKDGISKYNGKTFTNYTTKQGLVSENVRVVWYSKKFHLLFIGTNEGCSVFDGKIFKSLNIKNTHSGEKRLYVMGFLEGDDFVCICPYDFQPYYKFYPKTGKFIQVNDPYYINHNSSTSPVILPNGDTVMGCLREGVNILNGGLRKSFKGMGQVFDLKPDEDGNIWIASSAEEPASKEMPGGLYKYDGKEVIRYGEKVGITDRGIWCLYYDTAFHILWVGTVNTGLYKIPQPVFEWYDKDDFDLKELNVESLLSTEDNILWVGDKGSLFYGNPNGKFKYYNAFTSKIKWKNNSISPLEFKCIKQDRKGNIYVSAFQSPLLKFSKTDRYKEPQLILIQPGCTQFDFDIHDSIFYTDQSWNGIYYCSIIPGKGFLKNFFRSFKDHEAPTNVIKMISTGDTIWYASRTEGLFRSCNGTIDYFRKKDPSIPRIINDICFDGEGNVVIGSNSGEVFIVCYQNRELKVKHRVQIGKINIENSVKFLVVDNTYHLFVGTNHGLNRIDLKSLYQKNIVITNFYNSEVGYYDYSGKTAVSDKDDNIWVGTDNHLLKINTKLIGRFSSITPKIVISGMDVNYQPFPEFGPNLRLSHKQNNLIFRFEAVNYLNPDQSLYRYKLEGLSNLWSDFTSDTKSVINSLHPGKYKLLIESYNRIDISKIGRAEYSFQIRYPWYQKWWVIGIMVLSLILLMWFIIRYRVTQIRKEGQKKAEVSKHFAEIEMRALQAQMNPHFIFNSINSIQGFILKNKVDDAIGYLQDFSKIIRQTLENATKENISLDEEIEYIKWYLNLELMRFDKKFKVEFRLPDNLDPQHIQIPPMIIQPYIENAIRHGLLHKNNGAGFLLIAFSVEEENLMCVIEDNGVGRKKSREIESWRTLAHKPQSTRITQDRIELLNKRTQSNKYRITIIDLCDGNGVSNGTRVEINLPLRTL